MKNKIALVVGGIEPIGTEICRHLSSQCDSVIAVYTDIENSDSAKDWLKRQHQSRFNLNVKYIDIENGSSCKESLREIEEEYQAIDILVNYEKNPSNFRNILNITMNVIDGMS